MHLGRFHNVAWELRNYYDQNNLMGSLDATISRLQAYVSGPTPDNAQVFRNSISSFFEKIDTIPVEAKSTSFQQVVKDINANRYFGSQLKASMEEILSSQSLPSEMLADMQKFRKDFSDFITTITAIADGLDDLDAEFEYLHEGEFEFGMLFPREILGETISDLQGEIEHIDTLMKSLNELLGLGRTSPKVRTISASWWQFFLDLDLLQISALVVAIERIVALYAQNLEIKKLRMEIEKQELGSEVAQLIDNKIDEKLRKGIEEISSEIRQRFAKLEDQPRCNELEIELKRELFHIAKRINQGAAYEVRAGLPNAPKMLSEQEQQNPELAQKHQEKMAKYEEKMKIANEVNDSGSRISDVISNMSNTVLLTDYEKLTDKDKK